MKKLFTLLLALVASVGTVFAQSGTCGANLTWNLTNGVLTISGSGAMTDYKAGAAPWYSYRSSITSVTIGNSVTSIGSQAFRNCSGLTSVTIGNSVTSIGDDAFYKCSSLTSVTIPNSVTSIGRSAFYDCSGLTSVTIGNSVTSIGSQAFRSCSSLTSVTIGNSVTSIGDEAFYGCDLKSVTLNSNSIVSKTYGWGSSFSSIFGSLVTEYIIGSSVTSIGDLAFSECSSLTSITIPNSVTSIGDWAFSECSSLKSVTLPNSVTKIGASTFSGCSSMTSLTIGNKVTSIGRFAFWGCRGITSITIPNSVTSIGACAFQKCSDLSSIIIPNSVTNLGDSIFMECSSLKSVTLSNSVTSIGSYAFSNSGLTSVSVPNSVTSIGNYAFYGCWSLTSVTFPNSVTSIGEGAFYNCSSLTSVHICDIAAWCKISFKDGSANPLCHANHLYINGQKISELTIPNSVTSIGDYAFFYCTDLTAVTIPNSVTRIGNYAFYATIPNDTYWLGVACDVTCEATTPPVLGTRVFADPYIIVPCGTLDTYKNANGWSEYASRIKYTPYPSYNITKKAVNGVINTTSTDFTVCDEPLVTCTAVPDRGFYFESWVDGNKDNPRTIELTKDITLEAIFDYITTDKCGKDNALTWKLDVPKKALTITGIGSLSDNYTYGTFIESLTIENEISVIGQSAFAGCNKLKEVIIGSSVKVLENSAFSGCSAIKTITCYSQRPPTVSNDALYGLDYGTIVYVPKDYLETYKMHDAWGLYDVRPLGASPTETTGVNVNPTETTVTVVWPAVSGAATYELIIKDKTGAVVCTLVFNAQGQLTQIAFNAPGRNTPQQTQAAGFSFTVTGLDEGTSYDLTIVAKNSSGNVLDKQEKSFTTTGTTTAIHNQAYQQITNRKVIRNGQLLIQRGDELFNAQGARVK